MKDTKHKKKIAVVYDSLYPYSHGGVEKRNFEITSRLKSQLDFHFFSIDYLNSEAVTRNGVVYHGVIDGTGLYRTTSERSIFFALRFAYRLFFRLIKYRFDVVHCDAIPPLNVLVCWVYSVLFRSKLVVTWHEIWTLRDWKKYIGSFSGFFAYIIQQKALFLSPVKIFVSRFTKKRSIFARKHDEVILNGVSFPVQMSQEKKYTIGFVGRMIAHKHPLFFVKICSILRKNIPDFRAVMIGDGPMLVKVSQEIEKYHLTDVVDVFKRASDDDFEDIFCSISTLVLPSDREGFGMVVLEALLKKIPVVTLAAEGNAAAFEFKEFEHLFVAQGLNEKDFIDAVLNARDFVFGESEVDTRIYNWDTIAQSYFDLMNRL